MKPPSDPRLDYMRELGRREEAPRLGSRVVSLALQGGASLGAYTWGVLDALLEDGRLEIEGVTGSSSGAINAAALGVGLAAGGRAGARDHLERFWEALARAADSRRRGRLELTRTLLLSLPRFRSSEALYALTTGLATDFHMDPTSMEPLRSTLSQVLDLRLLGEPGAIGVFVTVTDVQTGEPEIFVGRDIDVDAICASCAVPFLFKPVQIRDRWFWDGSLVGNPAMYPVIYGCKSCDIVLVQTLSTRSTAVPTTAAEVVTRTVELASNVGLMRELRMIRYVSHLASDPPGDGPRKIRVHHVRAHEGLAQLVGKRSFRADIPYFHQLRDLGRTAGREWLARIIEPEPAVL